MSAEDNHKVSESLHGLMLYGDDDLKIQFYKPRRSDDLVVDFLTQRGTATYTPDQAGLIAAQVIQVLHSRGLLTGIATKTIQLKIPRTDTAFITTLMEMDEHLVNISETLDSMDEHISKLPSNFEAAKG